MGNDQSSGGCNGDCELAGSWVPIRHGEWTNRVPGISHSARARMPVTKMTYDSDGKGKGWVGEVHVTVILTKLARGHYSATAKAGLFWKGNDGNYTLKSDGTLEARYPSSGIKEYWKRASGSRSSAPPAAARAPLKSSPVQGGPSRNIRVFFRKVDAMGVAWHWALGVGTNQYSIFEVGGLLPMAIIGPKGVITGVPYPGQPAARAGGTRMNQFQGYVQMTGKTTHRTDAELETFSKQWANRHPVYNAQGPNCQTFTEDLYIYLTGENLGFAKFADLKRGPESSAAAVWL